MSKERDCATKLRAIVGKEPFQTFVAKVTKVDGATCTVQRLFDDMELDEVRLNCHSTENEGVVIVPETGSMVLITSIDGRCWFVSQCSKVEKITIDATASPNGIVINGGNNKGLVKIEELTQKLNAIEQDINTLKSIFTSWAPVAEDGGAALKADTQTWASSQLAITQISDYEDTNITH